MSDQRQRPRLQIMAKNAPEDHPLLLQAQFQGVDVIFHRKMVTDEAVLLEIMRDAHATIAGVEPYTERVLAASSLKVISRPGVGYDSIDVNAATARGIAVCNTPGANATAVADHAFALMLALARQITGLDQAVRAQRWPAPASADVYGQTLGILGLGNIGKGVARRGRGFDMRVVAFDSFWDEAFARDNGVERLPLEEVIRNADFLTLHLPSTPETRQIMNAERLAMMKPSAFLINAARGALVDEAALHDALVAGRLAGAGLDVFEREPLGSSPLTGLDNVILTPHSAYNSPKSNEATLRVAIENALLVLEGKRPHFCVNPEVLSGR